MILIEVHIYGQLKKVINPQASMAENTIVILEHQANESIETILHRLKIHPKKCGEFFIDGTVAEIDSMVSDNSRVALFPIGMHLLCGGQHLKGHGFIREPVKKKIEYF